MQINKTNLRNLYTAYKTQFFAGYQAAPDDVVAQLAMRTSSTAAEEVHNWLGAFPGMKEFLGEIKIENIGAHNYTIPNKEWYDAIGVKQADIERDEAGGVGLYGPRFQIMGDVARQHEGEKVADFLVNGFTRKCYTGKNFYDTDHEPIKGGTKFTNVGVKKLSQANFRTARTNIKQRRNAAGRALKLGRDLVLLVGAKQEDGAREFLEAERLANGASNIDKGAARLVVWPEIDVINEYFWALFDAKAFFKPVIVQDEKAIQLLAQDDPEDDCVFTNHEFRYQAYKRQGFGYGLPESIWASDGTQAA
jgi:phage major head subunit gpT-like protein